MRCLCIILMVFVMTSQPTISLADAKAEEKLSWWTKRKLHRENVREKKRLARESEQVAAEKMRRRLWRERTVNQFLKDAGKSWRKSSSIKWFVIGLGVGGVYVFCLTHKCLPDRKDNGNETSRE